MSKNQKFPAPDTPTLFKLSDFDKKPVEVKFINEQTSHDGGLLLQNKLENQLGLVERLARCINDPKHQGYVLHSIDSMIKQRVMQIAAGYEDVNDCNTMREDGILKICAGQEQSLSTQPTMCRLENLPGFKELYNMAKVFIDTFIASYPNYTLNENDKELITFQNRLIKYQHYLFTFLYRPEIPPDNDASERAIAV